jgi:hypothetical protein
VAIKPFQRRTGEWPKALTDLTSADLSPADWTTVAGESFGYEVSSDRAYVWGVDPEVAKHSPEEQIPAKVRPAFLTEDGQELPPSHLVTIR